MHQREHRCMTWLIRRFVVNKFTTATKVAIANLAVNTVRLVIVVIVFIRDISGV